MLFYYAKKVNRIFSFFLFRITLIFTRNRALRIEIAFTKCSINNEKILFCLISLQKIEVLEEINDKINLFIIKFIDAASNSDLKMT